MTADTAARKRNVLWAALAFAVLMGIPLGMVPENSGADALFTLVSTIGSGLLVLTWCHFDSVDFGRRLGTPFRVLVVLIGFFALVPYLFWTRGFSRGLRAVGIAVLVIAGLMVVFILVGLFVVMALET